MAGEQLEIMENKIPLPDMSWSIKRVLRFLQTPKVELLMDLNTSHLKKEIIFLEHNFSDEVSSSDSSL